VQNTVGSLAAFEECTCTQSVLRLVIVWVCPPRTLPPAFTLIRQPLAGSAIHIDLPSQSAHQKTPMGKPTSLPARSLDVCGEGPSAHDFTYTTPVICCTRGVHDGKAGIMQGVGFLKAQTCLGSSSQEKSALDSRMLVCRSLPRLSPDASGFTRTCLASSSCVRPPSSSLHGTGCVSWRHGSAGVHTGQH
jgi:hypothetical protein